MLLYWVRVVLSDREQRAQYDTSYLSALNAEVS